MRQATVEEFLFEHDAPREWRVWATTWCRNLSELWEHASSDLLVWVATREGVLDERTLRAFALHCARSVEHLLVDERSKLVLCVADLFSKGMATREQLDTALEAAVDATSALGSLRVDGAERHAAATATWAAATNASGAEAVSAWAVTTLKAAQNAAQGDDALSATTSQAAWLRANAKPNFFA